MMTKFGRSLFPGGNPVLTLDIPMDFSEGRCDAPYSERPEILCGIPNKDGEFAHLLFGGHVGTDENGEHYIWAREPSPQS